MKKSQLAVQFYTLREFATNAADLGGAFEKVRKIGYEAVQISGVGPIPEEEILKMAQDNGLRIIATHESGAAICNEPEKVIERLNKLNCKHTAYPFPHWMPRTRNGAIEYAKKINSAAEKLAEAGLVLSYHNHSQEFQKFDGEIMLDIIYREAPALKAEIDTFWIAAGGQNPAAWIRKFPGRQPLLHLKDYGVDHGGNRLIQSIGAGNLDWADIIKAGEESGVEYFIVEQDNCNGIDPFDAVKNSYDYISSRFFD